MLKARSHIHSLKHLSQLFTHGFEILLELLPLLAFVILIGEVLSIWGQLEFGTAEGVLEDYGLLEGLEDLLL